MVLRHFARIIRMLQEMTKSFEKVQRSLMDNRSSYSEQHFIDYFDNLGVSEHVAKCVWGTVKSYAAVEGFKPHPSDYVLDHFGIADGDLEELLGGIVEKCCKEFPPDEQLRKMKPIETVEDLAVFVSNCSEKTAKTKS